MNDEKMPIGIKAVSIIIIILYWWTIIGIIAGIFLWKGKNWARITAVILCGLWALFGFWLLAGVGGGSVYDIILITVNVIIIGYLFTNRKVDRFFGRM